MIILITFARKRPPHGPWRLLLSLAASLFVSARLSAPVPSPENMANKAVSPNLRIGHVPPGRTLCRAHLYSSTGADGIGVQNPATEITVFRRLQDMSGPMLVATALIVGCPPGTVPNGNGNSNGSGGPSADALPDFALTDINPASPRFNESISPRDYLGEVSAWYFGHST